MELTVIMENKINIIFDFSGSMTELGKSAVLKSMVFRLRTIADRNGVKAGFFLWQNEIIPFKEMWDIEPVGRINPTALADFITAKPLGEKYLLLSDGISDLESVSTISKALTVSKAVLLTVAIGRDANRRSLAEISNDKSIWSSADVLQAMDYLCHGVVNEEESS